MKLNNECVSHPTYQCEIQYFTYQFSILLTEFLRFFCCCYYLEETIKLDGIFWFVLDPPFCKIQLFPNPHPYIAITLYTMMPLQKKIGFRLYQLEVTFCDILLPNHMDHYKLLNIIILKSSSPISLNLLGNIFLYCPAV